MVLNKLKEILNSVNEVTFLLPNGTEVPPHFHVTEVGRIDKHFIDCGGTERRESVVNFQLWTADDYDHRLAAQKLVNIIELSEQKIGIGNHEIEVEYQGDTIGKYGLDYADGKFLLTSKMTDCLAKENCGIPIEKPRIKLSELQATSGGCAPGSGCC